MVLLLCCAHPSIWTTARHWAEWWHLNNISTSSQLLAWHGWCSENLIPHWRFVSESSRTLLSKMFCCLSPVSEATVMRTSVYILFFLWLQCHATLPHCHLPFISNENPTLDANFLNPPSSLLSLRLKKISLFSPLLTSSLHPPLPSLPCCNLSFISNVKMALILDAALLIGN